MPLGVPNCDPGREVLPFLIEELNAIVSAIGHEHAAAGVDGEPVQRPELARARSRSYPTP